MNRILQFDMDDENEVGRAARLIKQLNSVGVPFEVDKTDEWLNITIGEGY